MPAFEVQRSSIRRLIREHRRLASLLRRAINEHPKSDSLQRPFDKAYRPWVGETPTPDQAAAIAWRNELDKVLQRLRCLFSPWEDEALRDRYPLVDCETGALNGKLSEWVFEALDRHIRALEVEAVELLGERSKTNANSFEVNRTTPREDTATAPRTATRRPGPEIDLTSDEPDDIDLITVAEAAELTKLPRWRVYDLCRQQTLPGVVRFGRQIRIDRRKLIRFVEAGGYRLPGGWRRDS